MATENNILTQPKKFDPFAGPKIEKVVHTTKSQEEIWLACELGGDDANRSFNESISLVFTGNLNREALDYALQTLIHRHEALRSVFSTDGRFMTIFEDVELHVTFQDITNNSPADKENLVSNYLKEDTNYVFDLVYGPLFKVGLIKIEDTKYQLIITAHHIICDGWSFGIILEELGSLYSESESQIQANLPEPETYSSFADEQYLFNQTEAYKNTENFWLDLYRASVPQVDLPTDFPRPELRSYNSSRYDQLMDYNIIQSLKQIGVKHGCSLVTTFLAAFEVFLYDKTGQEDLVVGLPSSGQSASGKTQLIGHCVNLLPLRTKLSANTSFADYLKGRKSTLFDAYDHQQLTFGQLLQKLSIPRDPSRVPLVPVVFNIDMGMTRKVQFSNLEFKKYSNPRAFETFDLFLNAGGTENDLILEWSYNASLFTLDTIKSWSLSFESILKKIIENPEQNVAQLISLDYSLYSELNNTDTTYPDLPLHKLLEQQAAKTPQNTALKFGSTELTYEVLIAKACQMSNFIKNQGVNPGDIVGVLLPRSNEMLIALIAVLQNGASFVPLDPIYPKKRLAYMLNDSTAKFIITTKAEATSIDSKAKPIYLEDILQSMQNYATDPPNLDISNESIAYILYTSGSTGKPKGVTITHKNLVNLLYSVLADPGINEKDILISLTTISFDIAMAELFAPLLKGAKIVIVDEESTKDTRKLLDLIKKESVTMMQATPATWQMLIDSGWNEKLEIRAISTGEALPLNLSKEILKRVNILYNLYGPTETTIWSAIKKVSADDTEILIGHPIANTKLYIINENGNLVAPGRIGELCIAGDGLSSGYYNKHDLTQQKFIDNVFDEDNNSKLYKTGDLATLLPSGEIKCLGRIDHQVKIRGFRIELGEIEQLLDQIDGIQSSVVLVHNDQLVANIIYNLDVENTEGLISTWKNYLVNELPYYMIPQKFKFLKEFPVTSNGKINRKALLEFDDTSYQSNEFEEPKSASEKIISKIWCDCLQLENISINSDFFELGGHSLIGNKAMALLEKETGKRVPLVALLKHPTIKKLAAYMDNEFYSWDSLVPLKTAGSKPPLYIVHGANHHVLIFNELAQNLDKDQPVYGLQSKGLNGITEPHSSIDEMASDYVQEIVASNPEGPYALAGFSYGGIVAYEMARQLIDQGRKVTILAQFDTYVFPQYYFKSKLIKKIISVFYLLGKIIYILLNMVSSKKNFKRRVELIKLRIQGLWLRLKYGNAKQHEMQFNVPLKLKTNHNIATSKYHITPLNVVIDLFRANEEVNLVHDHKNLGWTKMALKGIRRHMVDGNHVDMFEKPHVKEFATKLQKVLDNQNCDEL